MYTASMIFLMTMFAQPIENIDKISVLYIMENKETIKDAVKDLEIGEGEWWFNSLLNEEENIHEDLRNIYNSYHELKDVPMTKYFYCKFKYGGNCWALLNFNKEYREYIEERMQWELDREDIFLEVLQEVRWCRECWYAINLINKAYSDNMDKALARRGYKDLMSLMKDSEDFKNGVLPPYTPHWRFKIE